MSKESARTTVKKEVEQRASGSPLVVEKTRKKKKIANKSIVLKTAQNNRDVSGLKNIFCKMEILVPH